MTLRKKNKQETKFLSKGEVLKFLANNPELINQSPYEKGWIVKLKIETIDPSNLLTIDEYKRHLGL